MKANAKKFASILLILSMMGTALVGCGKENKTQTNETMGTNETSAQTADDKMGGEITVAFMSAPENFDPDHPQSDWVVTAVTNHVYEGLFEFSATDEAVPHLAESYEIIDDGKTYDIKLRKGVKFSDGDEMKAEDVKASMERWFKVNAAGVNIADSLKEIEIVNDYEILVKFDQVYAPFISIIASPVSCQKMIVKKKEIIDKFGEDIITEHIGTGPYVFDDIVQGQKVVLKRNENYCPAEGELSGLAGKRVAYLDKVTIEFAPEESVRIAGLQSGLYAFADEISPDKYSTLEQFPGISPVICNFGTMGIVAFNCGGNYFSNKTLRQAVAYSLDVEELATAQIGDKKFWSVDDGSWFKKGSIWYDEKAGEGIYNAHDLEKAKALVKESGYNGETISILGTKSDLFMNNGALVLQNQLEKIGIKAELNLVDNATFGEYRASGKWDILFSRWSDMNPDPQVFGPWTGTDGWITNWNDEDSKKMDEIFARMINELNYEKRYEIVKEFYDKFWEDVPYIKTFNDKRLYGISDKLNGYQGYGQPYFWNVWMSK